MNFIKESDNEKTPTPSSTRLSGKLDSDRLDLGGNLTANDQIEPGKSTIFVLYNPLYI
jgi:hypothetical protein